MFSAELGYFRAILIPKMDVSLGWEVCGIYGITSLHRNFLEFGS